MVGSVSGERPFFTSPFLDELGLQRHDGGAMRQRWVFARCVDCADDAVACRATCRREKQHVKCSVCERVVKGRYTFCPVCEHGGHLTCLEGWRGSAPGYGHRQNDARRSRAGEEIGSSPGFKCPTGCGCECGANQQVMFVGIDHDQEDSAVRGTATSITAEDKALVAFGGGGMPQRSSPTDERTAMAPKMRDLWRSSGR